MIDGHGFSYVCVCVCVCVCVHFNGIKILIPVYFILSYSILFYRQGGCVCMRECMCVCMRAWVCVCIYGTWLFNDIVSTFSFFYGLYIS